jgi:hypothetical protein
MLTCALVYTHIIRSYICQIDIYICISIKRNDQSESIRINYKSDVYMSTYVRMNTCVYTNMYTYIYICIYMCRYVYIFRYI